MLARVLALRRTLRAIEARVAAGDDSEAGLTAEMLGALFTATMPLTSDPLLFHVLRKHARSGRGDWLAELLAVYRDLDMEHEGWSQQTMTAEGQVE